MKVLMNKNLIRKIAIMVLFVMCFSTFAPLSTCKAETYIKIDTDEEKKSGGSILDPIMQFLVFIADGIMNILQHNFITENDVVVQAKAKENQHFSWGWFGFFLAAVVAIAVGIATIMTGGTVGAVVIGILVTAGGTVGSVTAISEIKDALGGEFDIPMIAYNPYTIFSGEIPALDINFINPMEHKLRSSATPESAASTVAGRYIFESKAEQLVNKTISGTSDNVHGQVDDLLNDYGYSKENEVDLFLSTQSVDDSLPYFTTEDDDYYWKTPDGKFYWAACRYFESEEPSIGADTTVYFEIWLLNVSYDSFVDDVNDEIDNTSIYYESSAAILQSSIATWYKVLRRVALIGLLSVLVYIGIRIMLTAAVAEKAKYKKMFIDWLIAVCMLFVLHYIMIFILTLASNLSSIFNQAGVYNMYVELPASTEIGGAGVDNVLEDKDSLKHVNDGFEDARSKFRRTRTA